MLLSEFDYELPDELIAQFPCEKRDNSKMLVLDKTERSIQHKHFYDIVDYLDNNCVLILNDTKVIPARLFGEKEETGAKIEIFLLKERERAEGAAGVGLREQDEQGADPLNASRARQRENHNWEVLIKPSKRVKSGTRVKVSDDLSVVVLEPLEDDGKWLVHLEYEGNVFEVLQRVGNIPLPPYIERKMTSDELKKLDFERYQTVYALNEGSVAAPTAGLHFTDEILAKLAAKGVEIGYVTLNVGLGTFRPVKCENILDHKMDSETFEIPAETAELINRAKAQGKKVVAVGTTTVRTLETAYKIYGKIQACHDASTLFIYPPYEFKVVDNLITNFHLPKSTLLMLVSALMGKDFIFEAYKEAIANKYRFYSYGDCMYLKTK